MPIGAIMHGPEYAMLFFHEYLVYKLKIIVGKPYFSGQIKKII